MPVRPFAEPVKPLPLRFAPRPVVSEEQTPKTPPKQTVVAAKPQVELQQEIQPSQPVVEAEPVDTKQVDSTPAGSTSIDTQEQALQLQAEETAAAVFQTTQWLNGRPSWAQARFECLLFNVGGLTLAVPLVELGAIHPIRNEITPLFGQADWFMGLLTVKNSNIKTVNTPKLVMPERYNERMKEQFNYVISINGVEWGLAVDNVSTAIVLKPEDVRWRTERGKRPWLAGTVIEHMCALLDISQLAAMFVASSRQLQR
jgi:purine-binding chemotaxis protein CheW